MQSKFSNFIGPLMNQIQKRPKPFFRFKKRPAIGTLAAFNITIVISRSIVFAIEHHLDIPFLGYNVVDDYHIHHFAYGIILLSIVAFGSLFLSGYRRFFNYLYIMYGVSLALIYDEFGIWLKLDTDYHQKISTIAIIVILLLLCICVVDESAEGKGIIEKRNF